MLTRDWWVKNSGGFLLSSFVALALYAACAYIKTAVAAEMKNYVPVVVWQQWAQERGEWRGSIDQQLKTLGSEQNRLRQEIQAQLATLHETQTVQAAQITSKMDAQTAAIVELREVLRQHMQIK